MTGYLLDSNVLAEIRKGRKAEVSVTRWFSQAEEEDLYLSVLTLGEIRKGIELKRKKDPTAADSLEHWLLELERSYQGRILSISKAIADRWGKMNAIRPFPAIDSLLAATVVENNLTLVTRNEADFAGLGLSIFNPFTS